MLTMHDGERAQVFLFIAPGDRLSHLLEETSAFVPIGFANGTRLVARAAIAAIGVHSMYARLDDELPGERQQAVIRLRCGAALQGELRWVAPEGRRRTLDFLNSDAPNIVLHDGEHVVYVAKAHVASVEEV